MKYVLKNGQQIESIDIGKANIKIGQKIIDLLFVIERLIQNQKRHA